MRLGEVDIHFSHSSPTNLLPYHLVDTWAPRCSLFLTSTSWLFAEHSSHSFKHVIISICIWSRISTWPVILTSCLLYCAQRHIESRTQPPDVMVEYLPFKPDPLGWNGMKEHWWQFVCWSWSSLQLDLWRSRWETKKDMLTISLRCTLECWYVQSPLALPQLYIPEEGDLSNTIRYEHRQAPPLCSIY